VQPGEQPVQGGVAGSPPEDAFESRPQRGSAPWARIARPGFQVGIQPPDQRARPLDRPALLGRGRHEVVHQALGMHPAQRVGAHPELPGAVGHDHRPGRAKRYVRAQQAMVADGTPERALGGGLHRIRGDRERVDAEPGQVRGPRRRVGEQPGRVRVQQGDHRA